MHPKLRALIRRMLDGATAHAPTPATAPATIPMPSLCSTCRHWHRWPDAHQQITGRTNGCCRRRSPSLFVINNQAKTKWPATFLDDTCGDHRPLTSGL